MPLTKEGAKRRSADFMKDLAKTQAAERDEVTSQHNDAIENLCDDAASYAYRDTVGGAGRRGRGAYNLRASYLPSIINGQMVKE